MATRRLSFPKERACRAIVIGLIGMVGACVRNSGGGNLQNDGDLTAAAGSTGTDGSNGLVEGACQRDQLADVWLHTRLGCLNGVGQVVSDGIRNAPGDRADRAFVVRQQTYDEEFNNVLGAGKGRYFKYLVCVRSVGIDAERSSAAVPFATDLVSAFRLTSMLPPQVSGSTLSIAGGTGPNVTAMACDAVKHPVILDASGKIESVNPGALSMLDIFDI